MSPPASSKSQAEILQREFPEGGGLSVDIVRNVIGAIKLCLSFRREESRLKREKDLIDHTLLPYAKKVEEKNSDKTQADLILKASDPSKISLYDALIAEITSQCREILEQGLSAFDPYEARLSALVDGQ